jgi:lactoylglutathione lyase
VAGQAFPIVYAEDVARSVRFYELLGFERQFQFPPEGEPGYVGLARGESRLGVAGYSSPRELLGLEPGAGPRFELWVYVDGVDAQVEALRAGGATILREPEDMPWGERVAWALDPDGNPVSLANG